ncbi:hypothetical protein LCGC14_0258580 [marine sediment metagenome]|uniref:Uncharacterized protein n=1 Tax=marine sediment metagenome TaxID=412755 RepID=A0A0F9X755_9ZZZZ
MDATLALMVFGVGFIIFMIVLLGFLRMVVRVCQIKEHSEEILKELRYLRHLDEVKAGAPAAAPQGPLPRRGRPAS